MLVATGLFVFSAAQTFVVAVAAERDFSRWRLRPDVRLVAVDYTVMTIAFCIRYLYAITLFKSGIWFFLVWY
jgi:hypothetical protein